jgi:hypothetical protein
LPVCKAVVEVRKPIAIEANKPPSLPYGIDVRIGFEKVDLSGNSLDMRNIVRIRNCEKVALRQFIELISCSHHAAIDTAINFHPRI